MTDKPRVIVEPIVCARDPRGMVAELLRPDEFAAQRNMHLVLTAPGAIRGNHYHRHGTEVALILGPALVRYRDADRVVELAIGRDEAMRFDFPPGVAHAIQNSGDAPQIIVSFNTKAHDPARPDVVRDVLIES